ncbi:unnamed protein product [Ceratitis capitata]|uniref:(Mediterranean fruit fly) hypothetical protein n=1 Tax=Ceratitis capitata TaxID=7213 RepID=A0A811V0P2_CERCA|nr:unnamed protein product [Ceratitis capitata]
MEARQSNDKRPTRQERGRQRRSGVQNVMAVAGVLAATSSCTYFERRECNCQQHEPNTTYARYNVQVSVTASVPLGQPALEIETCESGLLNLSLLEMKEHDLKYNKHFHRLRMSAAQS